jgi:hypothetical protein
MRLITVLILGAVVAAILGAHAYSEGWKRGRKAALGAGKESNS